MRDTIQITRRNVVCICGALWTYDKRKGKWMHERQLVDHGLDGKQWVGDSNCRWSLLFILCTFFGAFESNLGKQVWASVTGRSA